VLKSVELIRAGAGQRGAPALALLDRLSVELARRLRVSCHVRESVFDIAFAEDAVRGQYYSSGILAALPQPPAGGVSLVITESDLFVPVLTFVFGEAQLSGPRAIVSVHRLREEFYGQAPDDSRLDVRLAKEAMHEIGHTQGLRHCENWRCAMASSHSVERLDLKEGLYCRRCLDRLPA
jgi:archaemetzincin